MADSNLNSSTLVMHHLNGYEIMDEFARKWIEAWEAANFEFIKFNGITIKHNGSVFEAGTTVKPEDIFTITWNLSKTPYEEQTILTLANTNFNFVPQIINETKNYTIDLHNFPAEGDALVFKIAFTSNDVIFTEMQYQNGLLTYLPVNGDAILVYDPYANHWTDEAYMTIQISAEDFYAASVETQALFKQYISEDIPQNPNGLSIIVPSIKGSNQYKIKWVGTEVTWFTSQTFGTLQVKDPQKPDKIITADIILSPGNAESVVPDSGGGTPAAYIDIIVVKSPSNSIIPVIENGQLKTDGKILYTTTKPSNAFPFVDTIIRTFADEDEEDDYIWVKLPIKEFDEDVQSQMHIDHIIYLFNKVFPTDMTAVGTDDWCVSSNAFNSNPNNPNNDADTINNMVFMIDK